MTTLRGCTIGPALIACSVLACAAAEPQPAARGRFVLESPAGARLRLAGPLGERVARNVDAWLLPALDANPGMLEMLRRRDRQPPPDLVPWAGEFAGKYLISAIQACRMTDRSDLRGHVARTVAELVSLQAEDGYLGPFPRAERLLGQWDLWGHYHCMLALLMWHAETGDAAALDCARRAADLVCHTYLDTGLRVLDAGSHEMNMAIIHALGWLQRLGGEERYWRMMQEIERDWESAGDYFRTGVQGVEFHRTPRPRWESLHDLQGLTELFLITGDARYSAALQHHWASIREYDRHPTGAFSTSEQAVGNPYSEGAIETCCTIAWMALSLDALRLAGDSTAADELELATWNAVLGAQHPSGRWWTYDTPVNGARRASAHAIVFQARAGTPELNCCSVNAPRGLGILSEWAVMLHADGPVINFYGPGTCEVTLGDGARLAVRQETQYPADGAVRIVLGLERERELALRLRIPAWSTQTRVSINGAAVSGAEPGTYLGLRRLWRDGDRIELELDMRPRVWRGELARAGRAAVHRGPLLMTFDPKYNPMDTADMPALDAARLESSPVRPSAGRFEPIALREFRAANGTPVVLCDFATAGAYGNDYAAWVPAVNLPPAVLRLEEPRSGGRVGTGPIVFRWSGLGGELRSGTTYTLSIVPETAAVGAPIERARLTVPYCVLERGALAPGAYRWRVAASDADGRQTGAGGPAPFLVDPSQPPADPAALALYRQDPSGLMAASHLDGSGEPSTGVLARARDIVPAPDRHGRDGGAVAFNGRTSLLTYRLPLFPERDFSFCAWIRVESLPTDHLYQVFSAWAAGMDDPLRVCVEGGELFARVEARSGFATAGVPVEAGRWLHVAAVKEGARLALYVDGAPRAAADVPEWNLTMALDFGIGGNPNWTGGNETFSGQIDEFRFYGRALTGEEIAEAVHRMP